MLTAFCPTILLYNILNPSAFKLYKILSNIKMDEEIEFLDEDADVVQQCFQVVDNPLPMFEMETELLVERLPNEPSTKKSDRVSNRRKRAKNMDDSDYDPSEEFRNRKPAKQKRLNQNVPRQTLRKVLQSGGKVKREHVPIRRKPILSKLDLAQRRELDIRIPDYDDPLCLPVRAIPKDSDEEMKLIAWNNLCLDKFNTLHTPMRIDGDETVASKRSIVLRNLQNSSGRIETTMYSKITVENTKGSKKSEVIRTILPRYREKKLLNNFKLYGNYNGSPFYYKTEVILTKEKNKEVDNLVVYDPDETLSSVYTMCEMESDPDTQENKSYLKETACCKVCAACYQASYREYERIEQREIACYVCEQPCLDVKNLVSHLKTHTVSEIRKHKNLFSKDLAQTVSYLYQCRICQQKLSSIKGLRRHVDSHRGSTLFICEIGNHLTK